jgi:hypothetical protein
MDKNGEFARRRMVAYRNLRINPCRAAAPGGIFMRR